MNNSFCFHNLPGIFLLPFLVCFCKYVYHSQTKRKSIISIFCHVKAMGMTKNNKYQNISVNNAHLIACGLATKMTHATVHMHQASQPFSKNAAECVHLITCMYGGENDCQDKKRL